MFCTDTHIGGDGLIKVSYLSNQTLWKIDLKTESRGVIKPPNVFSFLPRTQNGF